MHLANKRILITGATGGVGSQLAYLLAAKGAVLALAGRNQEKLAKISHDIIESGSHATTITTNLIAADATKQLVKQAKEKLGGLDVVICNAGVIEFVALENQTDDSVDNILQTNVASLIKLSKAALAHFKQKDSGHFVFVGSIFGSLSFPHYATYCASKFAVHGFSQSLRRELVDSNIGVTYIAPRAIKTPMNNDKAIEMMTEIGQAIDSPEKVASIMVSALEKEKQEVFIGQPQSFFAWLNGVAPKFVSLGLKKPARIARKYLH